MILQAVAKRTHAINYSGTHTAYVHVISGLLFNEIYFEDPHCVRVTTKPHKFFIWEIPFFVVDSEERFIVSRRVL